MSYQALTHVTNALVQDAALRPVDRLLWLLLANRHNPDSGMAWPSVATLAREAGVSHRNAQKGIRRLEEAGHVRCIARTERDGAQTSNGYAFPGLAPAGDAISATPRPRRAAPVSPTTPPHVAQDTPPMSHRTPPPCRTGHPNR